MTTTAKAGYFTQADSTKLAGIGTGAAVASVGATAPIASSGGATPTISIAAATTGVPGSLSAADKAALDALNDVTFEDFSTNNPTLVPSKSGRLNVVRGAVVNANLPDASTCIGQSILVFCKGIASITCTRAVADVIQPAGAGSTETVHTVTGSAVFTAYDADTWLVSPSS